MDNSTVILGLAFWFFGIIGFVTVSKKMLRWAAAFAAKHGQALSQPVGSATPLDSK